MIIEEQAGPSNDTESITDGDAGADRAALRASLLGELENLPDEPDIAPAASDDAEGDAAAGEPRESQGESEEETAASEEPTKDEQEQRNDGEQDPEVAKRLEAIQRQEKRSREAIAKDREQLERERSELTERTKELQQFEQLKRRARFDPAGVLAALGLGDGDWEVAARQLYARSPAAAGDSRFRESSERELRQREHGDELAQTRREVQELRQEMQQRDQREVQQRMVDEYLGQATQAIGDDTPLVRSLLTKNPDRARSQMRAVAEHLLAATGEIPTPAEVVQQLEKFRHAELLELGVDPSSLSARREDDTKQQTMDAGEKKKTATTLSNDLNAPTPPRSAPKSREELRADVIRELGDGRLE